METLKPISVATVALVLLPTCCPPRRLVTGPVPQLSGRLCWSTGLMGCSTATGSIALFGSAKTRKKLYLKNTPSCSQILKMWADIQQATRLLALVNGNVDQSRDQILWDPDINTDTQLTVMYMLEWQHVLSELVHLLTPYRKKNTACHSPGSCLCSGRFHARTWYWYRWGACVNVKCGMEQLWPACGTRYKMAALVNRQRACLHTLSIKSELNTCFIQDISCFGLVRLH